MLVSGFTIARNVQRYRYPVREAIQAILPVCNEFIVNVGDSTDGTRDLIESINDPRIRILDRRWDPSRGARMLSLETNAALNACSGTWAFYVQLDELIHEQDLPCLLRLMKKHAADTAIDGFQLRWLHFYGSYYRYRIDAPWFQKQVRIVRNNGTIESYDDAWGFRRIDGTPLRVVKTPCYLYHYGWVNDPSTMTDRRQNAAQIGFAMDLSANESAPAYDFGRLQRFPVYFGTHPRIMTEIIRAHAPSARDWSTIIRRYFWSPLVWFRIRYKTFLRRKQPIPR